MVAEVSPHLKPQPALVGQCVQRLVHGRLLPQTGLGPSARQGVGEEQQARPGRPNVPAGTEGRKGHMLATAQVGSHGVQNPLHLSSMAHKLATRKAVILDNGGTGGYGGALEMSKSSKITKWDLCTYVEATMCASTAQGNSET